MIEQKFSITRTHSTWKPRVSDNDLPFIRTSTGDIAVGIEGDQPATYVGGGRSEEAVLPYVSFSAPESEPVPLIDADDLPEGVSFDYVFKGGFNNNCMFVTWDVTDPAYKVSWVCIKTFTGMQVKYVTPKKFGKLQFAFCDEDAFAYCDKSPCEECTFRCKRGFMVYVGIDGLGIARKNCERVSMLTLEKD
jgi:hypothetical protein